MFYRIFRAFLNVCLRIFYREIEAPGLEMVPREEPLLLVANHGNALLDPLLLLALVPRPISFLAKHTLFPMPVIGFVLRRIGGLPIYRRQDAPGESRRNEETLETCRQRLEEWGAVCIFPEGISHDRPRLEAVKTGAARIFFGVRGQPSRSVSIVPVGINFEAKRAFRSRVLILFGRPVRTDDLVRPRPGTIPEDAVRSLTERIQAALQLLLPGLDSWEELEFVRSIETLYLGRSEELLAQEAPVLKRFLDGYRHYRATNPDAVNLIRERWETYRRQLARFSLTDAQVDLAAAPVKAIRFILASAGMILLVLPLAAVGWVIHLPAYLLCGVIERKFNRFPDLSATVKLLAGVALFPLTYLAVLALPVARGEWKAALAGLVLLPLSGWAALRVAEDRRRLAESARALLLALPGGRILRQIRMQRQEILRQVGLLVREQLSVDANGSQRAP